MLISWALGLVLSVWKTQQVYAKGAGTGENLGSENEQLSHGPERSMWSETFSAREPFYHLICLRGAYFLLQTQYTSSFFLLNLAETVLYLIQKAKHTKHQPSNATVHAVKCNEVHISYEYKWDCHTAAAAESWLHFQFEPSFKITHARVSYSRLHNTTQHNTPRSYKWSVVISKMNVNVSSLSFSSHYLTTQ